MSSTAIDCARDCVAVAPSATTIYTPPLNGIFVGGAGALEIVTPAGNTVTFTAVPAGTTIPVQASQVLAAATTATAIVGLK